ncbi:hypothetical protein SAMN02799624_02895 [Paenibacillus sp. UNC496MF]|uniref:DUF2225 domain-containing protein n=1 Tax=Paenibacillus sp. UNC496MF TaxID=1502753 RepID=UPI0008E304A0|nr:DUF2225 domain-containing protein [Paenibacillus sp. UNC496MF]SFI99299.1 hypothetical protein SAMN02799624_02895 [Paenibacillus sp. UNC496MF]
MELEPLYSTAKTCPCCGASFQTSRVRPSFKKADSRETDFQAAYKSDVNPDYYVVFVCPGCGFATTENGAAAMTDAKRELYYERIGSRWTRRDYGGSRTREQAADCFKLALLCAGIVGEKERVVAGILHHLAWLYRSAGNAGQERRFLRYALDAYVAVFETEGVSLNNAKLMYLIGELHRRLGEPRDAVRWFSRVVNDKKITDAAMIRASREQWQLIREEQTGLGEDTAADIA